MAIWEGYTVHRGGANVSNNIRPVIIMTFINLDSKFAKYESRYSPAAILPVYKNIPMEKLCMINEG